MNARGRLRESEEALKRVAELWGGHHVECNQRLAEVKGRAGRPDEALAALKRA